MVFFTGVQFCYIAHKVSVRTTREPNQVVLRPTYEQLTKVSWRILLSRKDYSFQRGMQPRSKMKNILSSNLSTQNITPPTNVRRKMQSRYARNGDPKGEDLNPAEQSCISKSHLPWNTKLINYETFRKRALKLIKSHILTVRTDLELRGNSQNIFEEVQSPLLVEGVIYAIIYLPANKIYVGQTIKSSYQRFKQHWYPNRPYVSHARKTQIWSS